MLKFIIWPFVKLKNILDPNYWANKIGNKTGAYDKADKGKLAKWSRGLSGWKWWAWQIGGGLIILFVAEFVLNLIGFSMLPWKW